MATLPMDLLMRTAGIPRLSVPSRVDVGTWLVRWVVAITGVAVAHMVAEEDMAHQVVVGEDTGRQEEAVTDFVGEEEATRHQEVAMALVVRCEEAAVLRPCMPAQGVPTRGGRPTTAMHRSTAPTKAPTPHQVPLTTTSRTTPTTIWRVQSHRRLCLAAPVVVPARSPRWTLDSPGAAAAATDSMDNCVTVTSMLRAWLAFSKARRLVPVAMRLT